MKIGTKPGLALVGCGRIGQRHAAIISSLCHLTAVCDVDKSKAESFARRYNVPGFSTLEEMLAETSSNGLVVCTPNYLHADHTLAGIKAGLHVLCEKPMAINYSDALKMQSASEKSGKKLMIVKQNRFNPPVKFLHQILSGNRLGKIYGFQVNGFWNREDDYYRNTWHAKRETDGGMLFTQFSHFIDLLLWLLGGVKRIMTMGNNIRHQGVTDYEDTVACSVEMEGGFIGSMYFTVNNFRKNMEGSLVVFGERGTIKIGGPYLNQLEYVEVDGVENVELLPGEPPLNYGAYTGSMSNHHHVYTQFLQLLDSKTALPGNLEAIETVRVIDMIHKSLGKQ